MALDAITIQKVKDAASIVDVVGDFVELRRRGPNYEGLCPFHEDRHMGNFYVNERRGVCKCFACDCGGHGAMNAVDFLMAIERLSFVDAIKWLGRKYGIEVEGSEEFASRVKACKVRPALPPLEMLTLPMDYVVHYSRDTDNDVLCNWLYGLCWDDEQLKRVPEMIGMYGVGTTRSGYTVFWQVDEECRVRTGKMMRYKEDGHRDKMGPRPMDWVHSALERKGRLDMSNKEMVQTLFGMHLVRSYPTARVNIVESEKTALVCAIAYGNDDDNIWMACGGKQNLTPPKLKPLMDEGRDILLFPDIDGIKDWQDRCEMIGYERMRVATDFVRKHWTVQDGPRADIADILVRMISCTPMDDMLERYPQMRGLAEGFGLRVIEDGFRRHNI